MTKNELLKQLRKLHDTTDKEARHLAADALLLTYINSKAVADAFKKLGNWYA